MQKYRSLHTAIEDSFPGGRIYRWVRGSQRQQWLCSLLGRVRTAHTVATSHVLLLSFIHITLLCIRSSSFSHPAYPSTPASNLQLRCFNQSAQLKCPTNHDSIILSGIFSNFLLVVEVPYAISSTRFCSRFVPMLAAGKDAELV